MAERVIEQLATDIDAGIEAGFKPSFWYRMRPSELGNDCSRFLWLSFRWATQPTTPPARVIRIFDRGHREEAEIVADIQATGVTLSDRGNDGKQYAVVFSNGHGYGKVDGAILDQTMKYLSASTAWSILEAKSHKAEKWRALVKHGLAKSFPQHHVQMQVYMHLLSSPVGLYAARNKDTEEDHFVEVTYDRQLAERFLVRADRIVLSPGTPERISTDPDFYACRFCAQRDACHGVKLPLRNCRTCEHSAPVENGDWACRAHGTTLTRKQQEVGCMSHRWIASMIAGTKTNRHGDLNGQYQMADGSTLFDNGPEEGK
jgi:hypothetical protein